MKKLILEIKNLTALEKIFLIFLGLAEIYYSYRYILRFGSSISPKGYSITPFLFQSGKFVLVFIFFLILFILVIKKFTISEIKKYFNQKKFWIIFLIFVLYVGVSLLKFIYKWDDFGLTQMLKMFFVIPVVFFIPFVWKNKSPYTFLKIFLIFSVAYGLFYNFIMIGLFYLIGRMPGLAFSDVLGRFGGGWDDPNGFAAFVVLVIAVLLATNQKIIKGKFYWYYLLLIVLLVVSLIYTFSVTGLVGLLVITLLLFFMKKLSWKKFLPIPITMFFFTILFYFLNYFYLIIAGKIGSAEGHLITVPVQTQQHLNALAITGKIVFGSVGQTAFLENFYLQFFNNFGLIGTVLLVLVLGLTIYRAFKGYFKADANKEAEKKLIFLIIAVYLVAFIFMNLVIPLFQDFPINLFVWIMIGLVWTLDVKNIGNSLINKSK